MLHVLTVEILSAIRAKVGFAFLPREFLASPERAISGLPPILSLAGWWWETIEQMGRGTGHGYEWEIMGNPGQVGTVFIGWCKSFEDGLRAFRTDGGVEGELRNT